jgi:hypothetical protein
MTANAIVMKLDRFLVDPTDSECKVVYLLCELRKLLEPVPTRHRPFALNMYCHWALHVSLHGTDTITPFLQQVDDYLHGVLVGPEDFGASNRMVGEFLSFETLRSQMHDFCRANGIRTDTTADDSRWNEFVRHYAGVIEDCSLEIRSPNQGLRHVKQLTFMKGNDARGQFAHIPFDMVWHVALLDGRSVDVSVNARPATNGVGQMAKWGIHLNA